MDKTGNPFTPTFGHVPFALAGRSDYIDDVVGGLANRPGDPNRTTIFMGSRGSGKTVLLTAIARIASEQGWISANVSAREGMTDDIVWQIHSNAAHLLPPESESRLTSIQAGPIGISREITHKRASRRAQITSLVDELNGRGVGVLFTIDEVHSGCQEFEAFVDIYQHLMREDKDVALLLAGLPGRVSELLLEEDISFVRRAFQRSMESIPIIEVEQALLETFDASSRRIDSDALALAAEATQGFAFAIQLIGYYLWRQGTSERRIRVEDVEKAIKSSQREMERSVFLPTLRELRPREEQYLMAMAKDSGPSSTSDVAKRMGIGMTNASNLRRRLIEFGVIYEVRMGLVDFEMPLLRDYLRARAE